MNDLIERIEAASGNDAELFWEAHRIANPKPAKVWMNAGRGLWTPEYAAYIAAGHRFSELIEAGAFTDAALTLVPEGWIVEIRRYFNSDGEYVASVQLVDSFSIGRGHDPDDEVSVSSRIVEKRQGIDPTPAAISAAAMEARAYLKETNNAD